MYSFFLSAGHEILCEQACSKDQARFGNYLGQYNKNLLEHPGIERAIMPQIKQNRVKMYGYIWE